MADSIHDRINELEDKLWVEFRAEAEFPDGVPEELQLTLLEQAYEEIKQERIEPDTIEFFTQFPDMHTTIDFCGGWCPSCEILPWCETPKESYTPAEIQWMKEHNDYPPEPKEKNIIDQNSNLIENRALNGR